MGSKLFFVYGVKVSCGDDNVRIYVIAVFYNFAVEIQFFITSLGSAILPITALAAATAGLAR